MKYKFRPKTPFLAVDGVVKSSKGVALIRRVFPPYIDKYTLPGGFVKIGESCEEAVKREVKEEIGIRVKIKKLVGVYSDPKRDPRGHIVSVSFLCQALSTKLKAGDDARTAAWFKSKPRKIAFDHARMLKDAKAW